MRPLILFFIMKIRHASEGKSAVLAEFSTSTAENSASTAEMLALPVQEIGCGFGAMGEALLNQRQEFLWFSDASLCTLSAQKHFVTKSPQNGDAPDAASLRRENVDFRIAHIEACFGGASQAAHGFLQSVGVRLAAYGGTFAYGCVDGLGEETLVQGFDGRVDFVADNGGADVALLQGCEHFADAGVGGCGVHAVLGIVVAKGGKHLFEQ